jgi:hypothetical protein
LLAAFVLLLPLFLFLHLLEAFLLQQGLLFLLPFSLFITQPLGLFLLTTLFLKLPLLLLVLLVLKGHFLLIILADLLHLHLVLDGLLYFFLLDNT